MGQMYITASPETQQAIAKTAKSASDTAKQQNDLTMNIKRKASIK